MASYVFFFINILLCLVSIYYLSIYVDIMNTCYEYCVFPCQSSINFAIFFLNRNLVSIKDALPKLSTPLALAKVGVTWRTYETPNSSPKSQFRQYPSLVHTSIISGSSTHTRTGYIAATIILASYKSAQRNYYDNYCNYSPKRRIY